MIRRSQGFLAVAFDLRGGGWGGQEVLQTEDDGAPKKDDGAPKKVRSRHTCFRIRGCFISASVVPTTRRHTCEEAIPLLLSSRVCSVE